MANVLLVDDEDLVRKVVKVVLEAEGHSVREAADGSSALHRAVEDPPDAIILDLVIPQLDGFEVCRRIKDGSPSAKVLVLSNLPLAESEGKARAAGADDVMAKPFSALELLDRLSTLLDG